MSTVSIGQAAALYDLAPSTLRWWERQGLLDGPERANGRRHYGERELRRIGLAYLCTVTGMMPLSEASRVTSDHAELSTWQHAIRQEMAELDRRIDRLRSARGYLAHLLACEDDDIAECPFLERELTAHTPRGRFPQTDLVTAARAAGGDETGHRGDGTGCAVCRTAIPRSRSGRPRVYCSHACQQRAYRARRRAR